MKNSKKGFTLVELLVVIAILAILATVAVVGYTSFIEKANQSNDRTLVAQLNTAILRVDGEYETFHDVTEVLKANGFDVGLIKATAKDHEILWDMETQQFFYSADEDKSGVNIWIVADEVGNKYSTYYIGANDATINTSLGFDAGVAKGLTVNYSSDKEQSVVIRTNGGKLIVNDTNAKSEQVHYGTLLSAEITTGNSCFYTYGKIASFDLKAGKAVVENGAYVGLTAAATGTTVEEKGGLFYVADETNIDANVLATLNNGADRSYKIGSKAELIAFREAWNVGAIVGGEFELTADVDVSGENWAPIGNWEFPFNGTFNGNGHTISGLTAVGTLESNGVYNIGGTIGFGECFGFIGIVGEGNTEVKDLTFTGVNINLVNGKNVGAVIGYAPAINKGYNGDTIDSVGTLTLSGVTVSGSVNANAHVGGLVGDSRTTGDVTFENCVNNANITATPTGYTGGIIGYANVCDTLTFDNCINNGDITLAGSGANGVGGLCSTVNAKKIVVKNCENNGNILSTGSVAGLINASGSTETETLEISNSKVAGIIKTTGDNNVDVLYIVTCCTPALSENTFAGIVECTMKYNTTTFQANLNGADAPEGYAIANINKCEGWGDPTIYHDASGDQYFWNDVENVHTVGYVVYNTNGEWTQIEGENIEYMAVGEGYYVFRVNGSDIYARYTENPTTDYRTLSQHPNHGQVVPN